MGNVASQARDRYLERMNLYKSFGYDRPAAVRFVVDRAQPLSSPVLDVGTGPGLLAIELAHRDLDVVSIDVNEEEQRVGIANAEVEGVRDRIDFRTGDAAHLPFPDAAFGAAASMDALHHLADGPAVFSELLRVVRPGGRILVAELTPEGLAIVARVHGLEGRHHPVGAVTFAVAVAWFSARGLTRDASDDGHLHSIAVFRKPE